MRRALTTAIAALAALIAVAWFAAHDAGAHALLSRGDPPINASLRESPTRVTLFMTERLQRSYSSVEVLDSAGQRRDIGDTEFSDDVPTQMSVRVLQLEPGVYTVVWRTLSEVDGHTWTGSYVFSVLNPDGSAPAGAGLAIALDRPGPPVEADAAVKAIGLVALVLFVGAVWIALLLRERAARALLPVIAASVVVGIAATSVEAISAALRLGDIGFLGEIVFQTGNGLWMQQRWYALIIAAAALAYHLWQPRHVGGRPLFYALGLLGIVWLASTSAVSHGAAIGAGWIWGTLFDALHLAAAALWIGGLASLLVVLRRTDLNRVDAVRRFSIAAAISVPILAAAGLLSALIQVPSASGLLDTDWGIAFIVKGVVLAALLTAAAANAFLLRPRDEASDGLNHALAIRFTRLMRLEAALGLAVIAASAVLTQLPSPASVQPAVEQKDNSVIERVTRGDIAASLEISPNLVGFNTWTATIASIDSDNNNPVEALLMRFRYADHSVGPVTIATEPLGSGRFQLEGAYFGLPGLWTVEMELRRASGDDLIAAITTNVESGYQASPFAADSGGALALPLTQMDWNGVGALWALVLGGLIWLNRPRVRDRWGPRGGDAAFVAGLLGFIIAVVLLTGLHVEPGRTLSNPVERTAASVEAGATLFAANCASCHGATGAGDGPLADSLPAPPANFTVHVPFHPDGVLFAWISEGIRGTGMPAWSPKLSDQDRWDLVNFLRATFDQTPQ